MGTHAHHIPEQPPEKLVLPKSFYKGAIASMVIGGLAFVGGLVMAAMAEPGHHGAFTMDRVWKAYLIGLSLLVFLGICGPFFMATQYLTRASWSITVRRIAESFTPNLIPAGVLALILVLFGSGSLYEWADAEFVANDAIVQKKVGYLNVPFMAVRTVIGFALMIIVGMKMVKNSWEQDKTGDIKLNKQKAKTVKQIPIANLYEPVKIFFEPLACTLVAIDSKG